jgi:hypothetical protein
MGDKILKINVYDDKDEIKKTVESRFVDIRFGTIKKLLAVLEIDQIDDTSELLRILYGSWKAVTDVLTKVFPEMKEEDWDGVKLSELLPVVVAILKGSFAQILTIPNESKNVIAE